ncbi:amidase [Kaistia dalseonensis]|uniref:Asp-tRNA(Asn)/Glu-tRNA(Gln) amidotransferase A subunit family amidase n=1 Tax=Kaistia dalseonensis TaxID=410840 RepID=A0ABU0H6B6_9HYPH|nr:amidase [Kaistia dalseonensis]MCX5494475.1 amidase [Kaistia dalseonensis]MDQ0437054.1 Asp-tRNA(Asn)/Glu-tRNA(Gln) amidotransferase A subunit family amidase [Kaistia dalseonensis]
MPTTTPSEGLHRLTATAAAAAIAAGELTSEALARALLDRIAARDPALKAWSFVDRDAVLRTARELDRSPSKGPLHGVPIGIKDMIDTADMPTQHNSPIYVAHQPSLDAACVETLRAAGALIIGKTETLEFAAAGRYAPTGNPHDLSRSPGGSSSGSAAAVADFQVPLALGTQTGGSTIRPASFCGAFALKPTWGAVSREGAKFYSVTFDTIGWYARSVEDLDLLAEVYGIVDDAPPRTGPLAGRRIGYCLPFPDATSADSREAVLAAVRHMRAEGAEVVEIALPSVFATLNDVHRVILFSEGRSAFLNLYRAHFGALHEDFRHRTENRDGFSRADLVRAYDTAASCRVAFEEIASSFDAILAPSAPGVAPPGRWHGDPGQNQIWTLLHAPVVNVPGFFGANGLPVGVSLTGPRFFDRQVLAVAAALASSLPETVREPA